MKKPLRVIGHNEEIFVPVGDVTARLRFHDEISKVNVNLTGAMQDAFALIGDGMLSPNRKPLIRAIEIYVAERMKKHAITG